MFRLRSQYGLPHTAGFRRGSIATALVIFMITALLIVPIGTGCIERIYEWLLVRRAHQYVQQVLPAACTGLNLGDLSVGHAKMQTISTRTMLARHFMDHCPVILADCLELQQIRFTTRLLPYDPDHWMGDRQPENQPIVVIEAVLTLQDGQDVPIVHSLEIFID
ncbi:MAG: hypothetical protein SCM11_00170 [Bacillota bacterium]|nr:hypothetical protein [Bacillota bacterium]